METKTYWKTFTDDQDPAEFIWYYGNGDSIVAVENFLRLYPSFLGYMRDGTWKETFSSKSPHQKDTVRYALRLYLEDTREAWAPKIEELHYLQKQQAAAEKARLEAEALAAAVARVEEDAQKERESASDDSAPPEAPSYDAVCDDFTGKAGVEAEAAPVPALESASEPMEHPEGRPGEERVMEQPDGIEASSEEDIA